MTERLYYDDPDLLEFTATVLSCEAAGDGWAVVLDRTAFFPEGGGQGADHGTAGQARVTDTREHAGVITHITDSPLAVGSTVSCAVDAVRRLDMMQQHSGEHIFSGLVCHTYGCSNVGFHIGSDAVTMDFDHLLTEAEARDIERRANEAVWADLPVRAWVPSAEELARTEYRSKKAIEGDVRLVQIPGIDTCACCGTHVQHTGRIGQIKLLGVQKYKKGVRISILCGRRALEHETLMLDQLRRIGNALSGKQENAAEGVDRLLRERDQLRSDLEVMGMRLFLQAAEKEAGRPVRVMAADMLNAGQLRSATGRLAEGARAAIVLLARPDGWSFACASAA